MYEVVLKSLEGHIAADSKEANDLRTIRRDLLRGPSRFGQGNAQAHLTGSAFVLDKNRRLLMTFHRKLSRWLQLGGHSERSEYDLAETAMREAQEESGLSDLIFHPAFGNSLLDVDIHSIPARKHTLEHEHWDFRYVFLTLSPDRIKLSEESTDLRWFTLTEVLGLSLDPSTERAIDKLSTGLDLK